jgi:hypothetical protein
MPHDYAVIPGTNVWAEKAVFGRSVVVEDDEKAVPSAEENSRVHLDFIDKETRHGLMTREDTGTDASATERFAKRLVCAEKALQAELTQERALSASLAADKKFLERMLDDRDRQFAEIQAEFSAVRGDRLWRLVRWYRGRATQLRRLFGTPLSPPSAQSAQTPRVEGA